MSKSKKDSLGDRQKAYEAVYKQTLIPKAPIVIRIDAVAFHTFTKGMAKPFDELLMDTMQRTMLAICKDLPTCKLGYTQSDEITLVCICDDLVRTEGLYKYKAQKIMSKVASKATKYFNKFFIENIEKLEKDENAFKNVANLKVYKKKIFEAEFDCRVMNIPEWDVINNIIWRQQDATRNSIQMLAQANFPHEELQKKNSSELQDKLMLEKSINWNNLEIPKKRGSCCYRVEKEGKKRKIWELDKEMSILTNPDAKDKFNKILFGDTVNNPLMKELK